ncbi:MAG: c-type cytochrome [Planctomycetes bacterium]|jgi:cytochrome c5|nr:c-type cytochrome [Planctomycetota bacterium]
MLILRSLALSALISVPLYAQAGEPAQPADSRDAEAAPSWREDRLALGKTTYDSACASCHDSGERGAPRIGVREDWHGRSNMWEAVLMPHAKAGYLEMPGKGGHPELSDEAVDAAAEYMLGRTLPNLPRD